MKKYLLAFFAISLAISSVLSDTPEKWQLRKSKNGINVYSKSVPGTSIKAVKAEMVIPASLNSIMALLKDVPAFHEWVYHCKEAKEIKRPSEHELYYYQYTSVPFPISDRDLIIHSHWRQDEKTKAIYLNGVAATDILPEKPGVVRMNKFNSEWRLIPKGNGTVYVEYEVLVDPAGFVPAWLVNMASADGPYETCLSITRLVKLPKYKAATGIVKEP